MDDRHAVRQHGRLRRARPESAIRRPVSGDVIKKATVLRIDLSIPEGKPPVITSQTVIADGFGQRADKDVSWIGPTGLALGPDGTLYVSDAVDNQIVAIPDAATRTTSAGTGRTVTKGGLLRGRWRWPWRPMGIC
jgi:sugar lactone lactonase YvrE